VMLSHRALSLNRARLDRLQVQGVVFNIRR
jgi:hypothetical protein